MGFSSTGWTIFVDDTFVSVVFFFTTGTVVLVRLFNDESGGIDGFGLLILLWLLAVVERDRDLMVEFCAIGDFDVVDDEWIDFLFVEWLTDATARFDGTVESFLIVVSGRLLSCSKRKLTFSLACESDDPNSDIRCEFYLTILLILFNTKVWVK